MTLKNRLGFRVALIGFLGMFGSAVTGVYKGAAAYDALETPQAQKASELEAKLNSNVNARVILANPNIYQQFTEVQQGYNSLMAIPEVKAQIDENKENEKEQRYCLGALFAFALLTAGGIATDTTYRNKKKEEASADTERK